MIRSAAATAICLALAAPCLAAPAEQRKEAPKAAPKSVAKPVAKESSADPKGVAAETPVKAPQDAPIKAQVEPKPSFDGPIVGSPARLARISDTLGQGPVTHAVTRFGDWSVACEIQGKVKACFASTYHSVEGVVMKLKVGPTEIDLPTKPRKRGTERFVLSVEGPQGLDPEVGYAVIAGRRSGVISLGNDCDKDGCRSFVDVSEDGNPIAGPEQRAGLVVMSATRQGRAFVWRFSADGFKEAFEKMKDETRPAGPSDEEIKAKRDAEIAEAKAREAREREEAEAKAAAMRAKATGVAGGWEVAKGAEISEDGRRVRVIDISAEGAAKAAAVSVAAGAGIAAVAVPAAKAPDAVKKSPVAKSRAKPKARAAARAVRPFVPRS